ncbi:MAG: YncE family protein [Candidatus Saccharibacteria bacterium]|nr:YncE family protein [Candidatus Saccharibacteria bacterium]
MNIINKRLISALLLTPLVLSLVLLPIKPKKASAAPTVTITSPTEGQSISGTNFTAAGTATPNTTVVLSSGGVGFAQTISDGSGNWSVATSLPAGNISLTAKAIENPEYGYFTSTSGFEDFSINQLRLSDNVVNPGGGWPIAGVPNNIIMPSTLSNIFYSANPFGGTTIAGQVDTSAVTFNNATGAYPSATTGKGDFSADGSLYFSPNNNATNNVSVINTTTNAWQQDIAIGDGSVGVNTVNRSPDNKLYASVDSKIYVIDPALLSVAEVLDVPCSSPSAIFSKDANYPYYFVTCTGENNVYKLLRSNNSTVATIDIGTPNTGGALTLDNKKLYVAGSVGNIDNKLHIIDNDTNTVKTPINLTSGILALNITPDSQKIFVATPNLAGTPAQNIDVVDVQSDTVVSNIATSDLPLMVAYNGAEATTASAQVGFVLGASAASNVTQKLAETGAIGISSTLLIGIVIAITSYLYIDFRAHKKPLRAEDPDVKYTFLHHIRLVSMPRLKYRVAVTFSVSKRSTYK